jgi:CRP/FNR family cyclic AMP-dependent transcriptional regulator
VLAGLAARNALFVLSEALPPWPLTRCPISHVSPGPLKGESTLMADENNSEFDPATFLAHAGLGRRIVELKEKENFFSQGDPTDSDFYLQHGRAKLTVVSQTGKEATISLLSASYFVGESALATVPGLRLSTPPPSTIAQRSRLQGRR